ncbi:MAG: non-ribosomal peptide synthetase, partial [Alteromonadaceae bacterium]
IIEKELSCYQTGQGDSLPETVPYREFVAHTRHQALQHNAETFFTNMLADVEEPTAPFNLLDVNGDGSRIIEARADVPEATSALIRKLAKQLTVSPAALFHSAWAMVDAACSGRDDVVFGTLLSGRLQGTTGAADMFGVFINTLPLRVTLKQTSVIDLIRQVQNSLVDLLPYEQAPLALAQNCSGLPSSSPLFSAMLNYRHTAAQAHSSTASSQRGGFEFIFGHERTNYPFILSVDDYGQDFALEVQVDKAVSAERVLAYMQTAVAELAKTLETAPQKAITSVSILPPSERHQLLVERNNTQSDYAHNLCIHELFEAQVTSNANAIAVSFGDQQLSYDELNQKANQLAHYLVSEKHVTPDTLVGICVERSLDMLVGILAILKSGAAYVPLDPEYPTARLQYILDDAGLTTVLTHSALCEKISVSDHQALCFDDEVLNQQLQQQPRANIKPKNLGLRANHLAYVIYTSGSTGKPKGVMIEHSNTVAFLAWATRTFDRSQLDCVLASTSMCFDLSIFEMFAPLAVGGSLRIVKNITALQTETHRQAISLINTVPSAAEVLVAGDCIPKTVKTINLAGEPLKQQMVDQLYRTNIDAVYDLYGPSEDTTYSTFVLRTENGVTSIGKPVDNCQVYLLNSAGQLVGDGIVGEICIGGAGLARGYLRRPDLSAEKFVANPFYDAAAGNHPSNSKRLYKTGDLARWLPSVEGSLGNLAYLGRIDHQVKIRGFRIELGEIENALTSHPSVKDVVVLARESAATSEDGLSRQNKRLVAYVVNDVVLEGDDVSDELASEAKQRLIEQLREHLKQSLPDYMMPSAFVLLAQLPLTPNGKIDRLALPAPEVGAMQNTYVAPSTETEQALCRIWQELLGLERVGINDDFFALGGHSLLVMKLIARLQHDFAVDIPVKTLFDGKTVGVLADIIDKNIVIQKNKHMAAQGQLEKTEW